jgi:PhnB protein
MKAVNTYLNFNGNAEAAFNFYKSVFGGEFVGGVTRYGDLRGNGDMGQSSEEDNKIANIGLPLGQDTVLLGSDILESMGHTLTRGDNFYIHLEVESEEEGTRLFDALSTGGEVEMPLQKTGWAEQFGICTDKFGVRWMTMYTGEANPQAY